MIYQEPLVTMNGESSDSEEISDGGWNKKRKYDLANDFFSLSRSYDEGLSETKRSKVELIDSPPLSPTDASDCQENEQLDLLEYKSEAKKPGLTNPKFASDDDDDDDDVVANSPQPSIDRDAIRNKIAERIRSQSKFNTLLGEEDLEEDEVEVIATNVENAPKLESSTDEYKFNECDEKKRQYIIRVTTKLPIPKGFNSSFIDFGAKGNKKFSRILESINQHYVNQFKSLDNSVLEHYNPKNTSLVWVEGKMEIKPFFKLSTLRIPPSNIVDELHLDTSNILPTLLNCLLIPKSDSNSFLTLYPEFHSNLEAGEDDEIEEVPYIDSSDDDAVFVDNSSPKDDINKSAIMVEDTEDNFVIGLKGKDNKRIEVRVSPTTKIMNLLTHYCTISNIKVSSVDFKQAKLIFDDEELDLNDVVGNTELEEDFEVQVVL